MEIIKIKNLTKDYGNNKGIFNVNLQIKKGEVFGFLGPNGAGKTTTIRHLMGFIHQDTGECIINEMDCSKECDRIQKILGYLPGEIAFMDDMTGMEFIHFVADLKGIKNFDRAKELIEKFELNPTGKIKKMSKGMKQKIGIICAFMGSPEVLILDEPTSGLDPLMQNKFIELILEEKEKGRTIFMSSHIFDEIEKCCDRTAIIKDGKVVAVESVRELSQSKSKYYIVTFKNENATKGFKTEKFKIERLSSDTLSVLVEGDINLFINTLSKYEVKSLDVKTQSLEELFMHFYGGKEND
ncbi:MAG: ABC transporter ATP-binding protein [Clostridium sp.]|uniref:ABC transporter ATP-binding protein n=1 Tax=Clostridium sp. TaxID=1506 RepID=UPI003F3CF8A2